MLVKSGISPFTALLDALHNRQLGVDALQETLTSLVPMFGDAEAHIIANDLGALHDIRFWLTQTEVSSNSEVVVLLWRLLHRLLNLFEARLTFIHEVEGVDLILDGLTANKPQVRLVAARALRRLADAPDSFNDLLKPKKVISRLLLCLFDANAKVACEIAACLASLLPYRATAAVLNDYKQMLALLDSAPSAEEQLLVARCIWNMSNCADARDLLIEAGAVDAVTPLLSHPCTKLAKTAAGVLMALAVSLRGKEAASKSSSTIALLCDIVRHHTDNSMRTNAAIALRHICEMDAALFVAGQELLSDPATLRQVLGPRATARVVNRHVTADDAHEHVYAALAVLIDDVDGSEAAFSCLHIVPYLMKDVDQGDQLAARLLQRLVAHCGPARAHLDSILRQRSEQSKDSESIETLMASLNIFVST